LSTGFAASPVRVNNRPPPFSRILLMFELDHDLAQDIVDRAMAILPATSMSWTARA
jgi:hypothetical protein